MLVREQACLAYGHPVEAGDSYCAICGSAVFGAVEPSRRTWPILLPAPATAPPGVTPIRQPGDYVPLPEVANPQPGFLQRIGRLVLALLATLGCIALFAMSEAMIREGRNRDVWVAMWMFWYPATVLAVAGWGYLLVRWARAHSWGHVHQG